MTELLSTLQALGLRQPVLHGGALRDTFAGQPFRDLDVRVAASPAALGHLLGDDRFFLRSLGAYSAQAYGAYKGRRYKGEFNSAAAGPVQVDLSMRAAPVEVLALAGDAPINSIAMGPNGQVYAHPDFLGDMQAGFYRSLRQGEDNERIALKRYHSLKDRYPALQFRAG